MDNYIVRRNTTASAWEHFDSAHIYLKPFEQFAVCTETVFWTLNRLVPTEVHYTEKNPGISWMTWA